MQRAPRVVRDRVGRRGQLRDGVARAEAAERPRVGVVEALIFSVADAAPNVLALLRGDLRLGHSKLRGGCRKSVAQTEKMQVR